MRKFVMMLMLVMLSIGVSAQGMFVEGGIGAAVPVKDNYNTFFHGQVTVGMPISPKALLGVEYTNSAYSEKAYDYTVQTIGLKAFMPVIVIPPLDVDFIVGAAYGWDSLKDDYASYGHLNFFVPKVGLDAMFNILPDRALQVGLGGEYAYHFLTDSHDYGEDFSNFNIVAKLRIMF